MGKHIEVWTEDHLAQGGEAVSRLPDGRVLFVRGGAPSERARVRLDQLKARFARASVVRVVQAGPSRVAPACPHANECGACGLLHLDTSEALRLKQQAGLQTLARVGGVHIESEPKAWSQPFAGARTRVRWLVQDAKLGFRKARSKELCLIGSCPSVHPSLERARKVLERELPPDFSGEVLAVTDGESVRVAFDGTTHAPATSFRTDAFWKSDRAGGQWVSPRLFSQASWAGNEALLAHIESLIAEDQAVAIELYAGSGNFTRLLAARFRKVIAFEAVSSAVDLAKQLSLSNVRFVPERSEAVAEHLDKADLCLVDPPRAGLEPAVIQWLLTRPVDQLVYVSCDVGTLARDLRKLREEGGFNILGVRAFDLYPGTPHVEWVATLRPSA